MPHRQDASLSVRLVSPSTVDNHWGGGRLLHATKLTQADHRKPGAKWPPSSAASHQKACKHMPGHVAVPPEAKQRVSRGHPHGTLPAPWRALSAISECGAGVTFQPGKPAACRPTCSGASLAVL